MIGLPLGGGDGLGKATQTAGTRIQVMCQGKRGHHTYVTFMRYTAGATAHTLTAMRSLGNTTLSAAAAAAQAVIALTADPGSIAANDLLGIEKPDGTFHFGAVSSVDGLNITLTANVPTGGFASGAKVCFFGVPGDSGHANYTYAAGASATTNYPAVQNDGALVKSAGSFEPVIIDSNNATNAGTLEQVSWVWSKAG